MFFGIDLVQILQIAGYPGIFAIILAESGLFFGVGLPGGSLFFTAGLLASQEYLNIWILLAVGITAATLGDSIGYWFGSWVGPALFKRADSRFFKKKYLFQTKDFFDKHGTSTIFLARFVPIIRTFAPILAGVAEMEYKSFLFYNAAGAVVWGGGFTMAGYILGSSIPSAKDYLEYIILGIVVVTSLPLLFQFRKKADVTHKNPDLAKARVIIFDLDETLSESTVPPKQEVLAKVLSLAEYVHVSIMSGAPIERIETHVLKRMHPSKKAKDMFVFSDSAGACRRWHEDRWLEAYSFVIPPDEKQNIETAIKESIKETDIYAGEKDTSRILFRAMSVAVAALPHDASYIEKAAWDPDRSKRTKLMHALRSKLNGYEIHIGGRCTIDLTREGVNKAHGVEWLAKELDIPASDMLFVGDAFYTGGNDAIVIPTGIQTFQTSGPEETEQFIDDLFKTFQHAR